MASKDQPVLRKMLDRLFASLVNGPSLNCRPASSRQRLDMIQIEKLKSSKPQEVLVTLLTQGKVSVAGNLKPPVESTNTNPKSPRDEPENTEAKKAKQAYADQMAVLKKLRGIVEDSRTYEGDTGVHVLRIGFPVLSLPPGKGTRFGLTRRIAAPLAFIPVSLDVKSGAKPGFDLHVRADDGMIEPNFALLAWLEKQTGVSIPSLTESEMETPWKTLVALAQAICKPLQIEVPELFRNQDDLPILLEIEASPRAEEDGSRSGILPVAVLGLYPASNQGLLRDTQAMLDAPKLDGPVQHFLSVNPDKAQSTLEAEEPSPTPKRLRRFDLERLATSADPCQTRAVLLSRTSKALVVYGPPGTGKSQTITNIVADHLARGERVLFVCDKRTALDVVHNRLQSLGLGSMCAIVHDPQRDQRELYKSIREQLDTLTEEKVDSSAESKVKRIDTELQKLHEQLTNYHHALMQRPDAASPSFHENMGHWLSMPDCEATLDDSAAANLTIADLEERDRDLREVLDRGIRARWHENPWVQSAGISLEIFLSTSPENFRKQLQNLGETLRRFEQSPPAPPFPNGSDVTAVAQARAHWASQLQSVWESTSNELRKRWAKADLKKVKSSQEKLAPLTKQDRLAPDLHLTLQAAKPTFPSIVTQIGMLRSYLDATKSWFLGLFAFGAKKNATATLQPWGLSTTRANAEKLLSFFDAVKARMVTKASLEGVGHKIEEYLPSDETLNEAIAEHSQLFDFLQGFLTEPKMEDQVAAARGALAASTAPARLVETWDASTGRAERWHECDTALREPLFSESMRNTWKESLRHGKSLASDHQTLVDQFQLLEDVLRVSRGISRLPSEFRPGVEAFLSQRVAGEQGIKAFRKGVLQAQLNQRIRDFPILIEQDGSSLEKSFQRYAELDARKKATTQELIRALWVGKQRDRLVVSTGSRLTSEGAEVRRRLMLRGERALRLRQVLALGEEIAGGDPLFDLRPVWMASPETVAQIFPRREFFDVIVFDEASQCRLEEALPVLLRGKRVVIAGDPKQLPPTRFFESAIVGSDEDEIETDQDLFDKQQGEIEDLLNAALNIEIEEAYLDVHYRSRNSDLIAFSNQNFYNRRLQAIPGHPANRVSYAPLTLYKTGGTYRERTNQAEAEQVAKIVRDLLKRAEPPTIGVACFNIAQRDLILDTLEELANSDSSFARSLANAWERTAPNGLFEGLFVKNLENVQGDERDHIIISTTYGPDEQGRFFRRFGPLGRAGGGRRLNVLVTRARDEVHLVTSIPETVYRNLPPIPTGTTPGGGWLLFSYLAYAEFLQRAYEENYQRIEEDRKSGRTIVETKPTRFPSLFSATLGQRLLEREKVGSDIHWGNEGFCVDLALHHPVRSDDVTIGVQCDMNRFEQAADPVEWEVFRNLVLESQGWKLHRIWTPRFLRDPQSEVRDILKDVQSFLKQESKANKNGK